MATVYKRKDRPGWYLQYRINGKVRTRSLGNIPKKLALQIKRQYEVEIAHNKLGVMPDIKLTEAHKRLKIWKPGEMSIRTEINYRTAVEHWTRIIGDTVLQKITPESINAFLAELLEDHASGTVSQYAGKIRSLLNLAMRNGYITVNPFSMITLPRETSDTGPIPLDHLKRFFAAVPPGIERLFFLTLFYTGCRVTEIIELEWKDIYIDHIVIRAEKAKTRRSRSVYLRPDISDKIHGLSRTGRYVFRKRFKVSQHARYYFQSTFKRLGLPEYTTHRLRHTFATINASRNDINTVKFILGHSTIKTTENYAHFEADEQKKIIDGMPKIE